MIDLHCHVLPGLDDGPTSTFQALAMARIAVASGTTTLVATPHIDVHWRVNPVDLQNLIIELAKLRRAPAARAK